MYFAIVSFRGPKPDHRNRQVVSVLYAPCATERTSDLLDKFENNQLQPDRFNPPVATQPDPARLNEESAVNCPILFLSKLQQGDMQGAAAATEDPDTQAKM